MANRQIYVVGALGVLIGMVVGANSAHLAETVSFSGNDPNSEAVQNMPQLRRAAGILRQRSAEAEARVTAPERSSIMDSVARRREIRLGDLFYFSAPSWTVRGIEAPGQVQPEGCDGLSGRRFLRCVKAFLDGDEDYETNYYEIEYQD